MPFDGTEIETPALRRAILVDALRHEMPEGFRWDFRHRYQKEDCGSSGCALGLASLIWPDRADIFLKSDADRQAEFFGLSTRDANRIFWDLGPKDAIFYQSYNPRPTTVARALERAPLVVNPVHG